MSSYHQRDGGGGQHRSGGRGGSAPPFQYAPPAGGFDRENQQQNMRAHPTAHAPYPGAVPMSQPRTSRYSNSPPRPQQQSGGRYHPPHPQQQQQKVSGRNTGSRGRGGRGGSAYNSPSPQNRTSRGGGAGSGRGGGRGHYGEGASFASSPPTPASGVPWGFLPPFLPGSASLLEQLDQRLLIVLRDGRHLVGILRSFDQYSNMLLEDSSERRMFHSGDTCFYTDVPLGLYVVRGDSMVLLGEVMDEEDLGEASPSIMKKVSLEELCALQEDEGAKEEVAPDKPETGTGAQDTVNWDFDTDLVV